MIQARYFRDRCTRDARLKVHEAGVEIDMTRPVAGESLSMAVWRAAESLPAVRQRLYQAGVRLARVLNEAFSAQ